MLWLYITVLSITWIICDQSFDKSHLRVFPAEHQSIAGVFQVSYLNGLDLPQYTFNASEARRLCLSLGVNIATKAQVKEALSRGLETCRFGWIDEHFAVIPRNKPLSNCGRNQTGLVMWRAAVIQKFDVFCFNESEALTQLKSRTTDSSLDTGGHSKQPQSPSKTVNTIQNTPSQSFSTFVASFSTTPNTMDVEVEPAQFVRRAQGCFGARTILITSSCALLLIAVIILAFIKMNRNQDGC